MRITTKGKYGMLMLTEIASQEDGKALPLKVISKRQNISEKYLEQIVIPLTKAGVVKSVRGSQGGYVMGVDPGEITAGMILEILEGEQSLRACIGEVGGCPRAGTCSVIDLWKEVNQAIKKVIDNITLADLVERRCEKVEALGQLQTASQQGEKPACNE